MAALTEPWSKRHKAVTKNDREGLQYNLSNSFAQPTSQAELERLAAIDPLPKDVFEVVTKALEEPS